jgi:magnesium chelatase subunit ChlD-like protein
VPHWWNERWLASVGGGGGTPFVLGIETASALLERAARKHPAQQRCLWIFTDGRSSGSPMRPAAADRVQFVDFEHDSGVRTGRCARLAEAWGGECIRPHELLG